MMYLVALILPPLAILCCGKPFQSLFNLGLLILTWMTLGLGLAVTFPICVVHALFVAHNYYADQRSERMVRAIREARADAHDDARDLAKATTAQTEQWTQAQWKQHIEAENEREAARLWANP